MSTSSQQAESPYRQIAGELRARILAGDLRPGDRVPSVRQIAQRWGVAAATATRVTAVLRDEGLVEARVGSGTVVSGQARRGRAGRPVTEPGRPDAERTAALSRDHLLRAAIEIADAEGLEAVSMRRLAAHLGVGPMSLYRHVANKDELLVEMADRAFGEIDLPATGPEGWRARLELAARRQWALCRKHLWLPRTISFTRPLLAPNMMAQTEWTLRALDGFGLDPTVRMREALALHGLVLTAALSLADEVEAEQDSGVTLDRWHAGQAARAQELLRTGRFPLLASVPEDAPRDLDAQFEYGLARHLDGFAVLVGDR
ncbi:TetR/AcrR family transcriptional regulator C-terminal domain-containing protein [Promicromonospora sukumoe]|uniref:TetR/AcrR family transcriptional regulator C-terminal domain-containing protein n=1 Tax=Promicromonospora sukumoe TaxID=88382 RepID=UPI00037B478E|nr:GntR family transcriptional regulator [Promicromonospora sukumoe]